jgi:branched-chain amino acid transport system permease protein
VHLVDVLGFVTAVALMLVLDWLIFRTTHRPGRLRAVSHDLRRRGADGDQRRRGDLLHVRLWDRRSPRGRVPLRDEVPRPEPSPPSTWVLLGLKAFVAAVIGGIGNIRGAMLGGILIGFIELFGAAYLSPHLRDIYVFSILILVLSWRPSGDSRQNRRGEV